MFIETGQCRLYVQIQGQGQQLILVHGNGENHHIFDEAAELLQKHFTVITVDSRCHGLSQKDLPVSYDLMAQDMINLMEILHLDHPVYYGFSDGGIIGLLIAIRQPHLLSRLIISGANLEPSGLKSAFLWQSRIENLIHPDPLTELMLKQPHIPLSQLRKISIPVHVLAAEKDLIRKKHTCTIAANIPDSTLDIIPGHDHGSYIVHNPMLAGILKKFCQIRQ